jgi:hypothetical protein
VKFIEGSEFTVTGDQTADVYFDATRAAPSTDFPYLNQGDDTWTDSPFGPVCGTIQSAGCGPTSLAMVLQSFGYAGETPVTMAQLWSDLGYRVCNDVADRGGNRCNGCGNRHGIFTDEVFLNRFGLETDRLGTDRDKIIEALSDDKPIIASMSGPSIFTSQGHFIVLVRLNTDGTITVHDPGRNPRRNYCNDNTRNCGTENQTILQISVPQDMVFEHLTNAYAFSD